MKASFLFFLFLLFGSNLFAQKGNLYLSWGYNREWYTPSTIHVNQPLLGNNYAFVHTLATDKPGWNENIFKKPLTIPQYNYRIGWYYTNNSALEINFDHTKYNVSPYQNLHIKGTIGGQYVDTFMDNAGKKVLDYQLNNGANFLLFNFVKFFPLKTIHKNLDIRFVSKQGVGIVIPHVENWIFGVPNKPHFQFGGVNVGYEAGVNVRLFKYFFLEFTNKLDYAWYWGLRINNGKIHQHFGTFEVILVGGINLPLKEKKEKKSETTNL